MDAVDAPTFERITRVPGSFEKVLAGIRAARAAGLAPLKINCVLLRGFNDDQIEGFAHFAREEDVMVRFIEFMPLEEGRLWTPEIVVPLAEIVERIERVLPLVAACRPAKPAKPPAATPLPMASAKSASSRPSPRHSAEPAAACVSPPMARSAPVSSRRSSMIFTAACEPAQSDDELRQYIHRTVQGKEARHHIGEPGFLKPSRPWSTSADRSESTAKLPTRCMIPFAAVSPIDH